MSLKDLLEAKQVRRATVPVLVSDPHADAQIVNGVAAALATAQQGERPDEVKTLLEQLERAQAALDAHWANVELRALSKVDWNAAATLYQDDEGGIDMDKALPELMAVSCVDPDVRDADWWTEQLAKPGWSQGDTAALQVALLRLNVDAAPAYYPKG